MNIKFNKIILHNFLSFGDAEIDLDNKGYCLVSGENHFKKDTSLSNGSGKSTIWSGICYALTGETVQGIHTNLKNINASEDDEMFVELYFNADGKDYVIKRGED